MWRDHHDKHPKAFYGQETITDLDLLLYVAAWNPQRVDNKQEVLAVSLVVEEVMYFLYVRISLL